MVYAKQSAFSRGNTKERGMVMKLKRTIGGALAAVMLLLCAVTPARAGYVDLPASHWAYEQMSRTFAPERYRSASQSFAWDRAGYLTALEEGMILPDDFLPVSAETLSEPISRQDTAVLLSRVIPESAEAPSHYWFFWDDEEPSQPTEAWQAL